MRLKIRCWEGGEIKLWIYNSFFLEVLLLIFIFLIIVFYDLNLMQIFIVGNQNNQPTEKVKKVKDDYERKLNDMQKEMKKLQTAKKEHSKMLRNQSQYESQIKTLRNEVTDMKKVKVSRSFLITLY